ncbi:MAG: hypothetical protein Q4G48_05245 [Bacteroidia bacterium]|nr:hypothetical protein [Bacteroidia bacterium]
MLRIIGVIIVGVMVSGYFFTFGLSFIPASINSKMVLAVMGALLYVFHSIRNRQVVLPKELIPATGIVALFSVICFFTADYNGTVDYSYADYIVSFATWLAGGYVIVSAIKSLHGRANFKILTAYLTAVCVFQCAAALIIDNNEAVKTLVDSYILQGQVFLNEIGRLYGIGASLDPAGVRFSIVMILIAFVVTKEDSVKSNKTQITLYFLAFFIIGIIGNMISRTTSTGMLLGLGVFLLSTGINQLIIRSDVKKVYAILALVLIFIALTVNILYQSSPYFYDLLRFAFEGFFNWMETGVWRTDSTDKLNAVMWVWPTDIKTWIIGSGLFENWAFGTDIGYCRFILYCGLIGFGTFALLFIYSAVILARKFQKYRLMFLFLILLSGIIWLKVATDLFLIYALFYWLEREPETIDEPLLQNAHT